MSVCDGGDISEHYDPVAIEAYWAAPVATAKRTASGSSSPRARERLQAARVHPQRVARLQPHDPRETGHPRFARDEEHLIEIENELLA
jgi:hypothetical protein